ncbi:MAG: HAD-IIA family hydrolase [Bauldia sp.]|nr:HAD-IIA family hydrolase [Bauldia sp.]
MTTCYLLDMDGVLVRGGLPIPGSVDFVNALAASERPFQIFTNNSRFTPEDHAERLRSKGFNVSSGDIFTSALATARFVEMQAPGASVYVIGENGLVAALQAAGCRLTEYAPDFVILGDTISYHYEQIATGALLVSAGARFLATNPDVNGPTERGMHPACGAVAALIEAATSKKPYFVGKPNPFMMRCALDKLGIRATDTLMVGDRMDTDILAGIESGLKTALVLTGVTSREEIAGYPFRPDRVLERLADLAPEL